MTTLITMVMVRRAVARRRPRCRAGVMGLLRVGASVRFFDWHAPTNISSDAGGTMSRALGEAGRAPASFVVLGGGARLAASDLDRRSFSGVAQVGAGSGCRSPHRPSHSVQ